ncbi:reverse transcriptase domain-containing protein [Tanacetum coccineum]
MCAAILDEHLNIPLAILGVADALTECKANISSGNGDDSHDSRSGGRRPMPTTHECTYSGFLKCQPLNFKGTKGVVGLNQWFEKMESVFHISNCIVACQIKFATCTLLGSALTIDGGRMFPEESDQVEKYVGGLPDMIQGSVMASKPKTMQKAIEFANDLMDQKITYFTGPSEKKEYAGTLRLRNKWKLHHNGPCTIKCANCNRVCHLTRDCRSPAATANNQRTLTCYECRNQWHYKSDCPEIKNRNHGNQTGGTEACGMVYALGGGETDQDLNNMEDNIDA